MKPVLVIGSSNTDMVLRLETLPRPGETVLGSEFRTFAGGKGANQAVAARRAGAEVCFLSAVGNDDFGRQAIAMCAAEGIDTDRIAIIEGISSGVAMIFVSDAGENCIGVSPGANNELTAASLDRHEQVIAEASVILLQLETPIDTVTRAVELAARHGIRCVLNPAPAATLPEKVFANLFCLTPNQREAEILTGIDVSDFDSAHAAASSLLDRGVQNVVITMGRHGALLCNSQGIHCERAEKVNVIDTTGAGDTFNGVFAAMLATGSTLENALNTAVDAATNSVQSAGAIDSIPYLRSEG